ncbi:MULTISPECIES: accessory gene regulator ArgB-like protein [Paenibacillus]|uniref:Accessory gene regulator B n=1 Tax=Paenibacillus pabuli TaxID=1472 RepID=A0A855Y953_9BACL|nr:MULTISPECIES: accessory gene regulator B family protein [Paenibacillus]PWW37425.1 accessory gene regulator B [Paenibacillus pabuli]PXW05567.1 accessory gene regulator B [Paenibacillus taichungensis]
MIEMISYRLAKGLKDNIPHHPASMDVFRFSIAAIINALSIIIFTLLISLWTDKINEATIVLIAFAILRQVSGGIHLNSGDKCVLVTTLLFTAITFTGYLKDYTMIMTVLSMILALIYAPSRIENQSRIDPKHYPFLKLLSIIIIATNLLIDSSVLAATFFVQCLTLIKIKGVNK